MTLDNAMRSLLREELPQILSDLGVSFNVTTNAPDTETNIQPATPSHGDGGEACSEDAPDTSNEPVVTAEKEVATEAAPDTGNAEPETGSYEELSGGELLNAARQKFKIMREFAGGVAARELSTETMKGAVFAKASETDLRSFMSAADAALAGGDK